MTGWPCENVSTLGGWGHRHFQLPERSCFWQRADLSRMELLQGRESLLVLGRNMVRASRNAHPSGVYRTAALARVVCRFVSIPKLTLSPLQPLMPRLRRPFTVPTTSTWHRSFDGRLRLCESAGGVSRSAPLHKLAPAAASKTARRWLAGGRRRVAPPCERIKDPFTPLRVHGSRFMTTVKMNTRRVFQA
jgi:hypothetical protein